MHREYYVNDAGRQMDILAASVWLRYLELCGESLPFPANGYRGDYVRPVAARLREKHGDALRRPSADVLAGLPPDEAAGGDKDQYVDAVIARARALLGDGFRTVFDAGLADILADIQGDLAEFGVTFDRWYSEQDLGDGKDGGPIDRALRRLRANGHVFEQDGATWFRATQFGDEKDRVVVRANGQKTYFASDIAYHLDKRERGFDLLVTILGADHHGYVARVRAGLAAMGEPPESLEVPMIQFVTLLEGRREGRDGQARGAVRDAPRPARRSRQRRRALHLRDALARPDARLRPRARQEAEQRQPGLLRAVRARAHRERAEAGRRARPRRSTAPPAPRPSARSASRPSLR